MNKRNILFLLLAAIMSIGAMAQGHKNLRITEVMVQDSTRGGNAWIELYNSSYGTYAIEKMFITTKRSNELFTEVNKKEAAKVDKIEDKDAVLRYLSARPEETSVYMIPRGDERNTKVGPHMQVVFDADGDRALGTFHLPFKLTPGQDNYIALYDVDGELVDEVIVPANLPAGQSWALKSEGRLPIEGVIAPSNYEMRDGSSLEKAITRGNFNTREANENIEKFHKGDSSGIVITLCAMGIVFSALCLLFLLFKLFGVVSDRSVNKKKDEEESASTPLPVKEAQKPAGGAAEEEIAAICMALYQHFNAHDEESGVLTFKRNTDTAWSSKAAMMRVLPERRP